MHPREPLTAWAYVPENALLVYETDDFATHWQHFRASSLGNALASIPSVQQFDAQLAYLDSLSSFGSLMRGQPLLTAWQVVGDQSLDATFFLRLADAQDGKKLRKALKDLKAEAELRAEERQYEGHTIYELHSPDRTFSYILHQGVFAGSFTPFLIEDVVRSVASEFAGGSFVEKNRSLLELPRLTNDEGNLYINARRLSTLLSTFTRAAPAQLSSLDKLSRSMLLDVSVQDEQLLLNGFSEVSAGGDDEKPDSSWYLQTFNGQSARSLGMGDYIPNRTSWLYYLSFAQASEWYQRLTAHQQATGDHASLVDRRVAFAQKYNGALTAWYDWVGQEVALLTLESIDAGAPDQVALIEVADTARAKASLRGLSARLAEEADGEAYQEAFANYDIGELMHTEVPSLLFGPMAQGYNQCFYLLTERYLIMANNVRALRRVILDQEAENTWSKSLKQSRFLESTINESNLSLVVDIARSWNLLLPRLSPEWQKVATEYATQLKQLEKVTVQFSENDDTFYTSVSLSYPKQTEAVASAAYTTAGQVQTDEPLRTKPFVVRNQSTQALEVLVQDEDSVLQLISSEQEVLWKQSLSAAIISNVEQIDFFNNGKLQYLFASDSAIYLIDRNGEAVAGYPLYMPAGVQVQHLALIDYDNSKQYRFLVSDTNGGLWMFNTDRENLEGWNPNGVGSIPATPPFHVRVRGKDCLIAIGTDGTVYVKNRRGEDYPGFPLQLNRPCHSRAFVAASSTFEETTLTIVTDGGELITFNLLGEIAQREQLYRPSSDAYFQLCEDALGKTFVVLRQDAASLGVLDRKGTLLFEKNFLSPGALASGMLAGQYYDFGAGNEVYALTDRVQEFTYLLDRSGALINDRPVESDHPIGLLYSEDRQQYRLYRNFGNEFAILSF